jgi:NAD-specific glutamate dehydrogenase
VIGEQGFLGLYTSGVYTERPDMIPLLRKKVANIRRRSRLDPHGFDGKILAHVLASHPRDELFQSSEDELFATAMGDHADPRAAAHARIPAARSIWAVLHLSRVHAARALQHAVARAAFSSC